MKGQADAWAVLDQDPTPGVPDAIHRSAGLLGQLSDRASDIEGRLAGQSAAGAGGWQGATADAHAGVMGAIADEVRVLAGAAVASAQALSGWASTLEVLQERAAEVLAAASAAAEAQLTAEERLAVLHQQRETCQVTLELARGAWAVADREAELATAVGDPQAPQLQAVAERRRHERNDAEAALRLVEEDLATVGRSLQAAQAALAQARADAALLADTHQARAVEAAGVIPTLPVHGLDLVGDLGGVATGVAAPAVPAAAHAVVPPPLRPNGSAVRPVAGTPGTGRTVTTGRRPVAVGRGSLARPGSILAVLRRTGRPLAVGRAVPAKADFRRFRQLGLQPVTSRGAAVARALGFEGDIGGLGWRATRSDHGTGLAIDLMTGADTTTGDVLAAFYRTHHEELGVTYVIWDGRIASHVQDWAWRPYRHPAGRTDPTAMHLDHVHVSFDPAHNALAAAAMGATA